MDTCRFPSGLLALLLIAAWMPPAVRGQEAPDTSRMGWTRSLGARLSGSQAAYNNWREGGVNTLAVTATLDGKATRRTANWEQNHEGRLAFGVIRQESPDFRKADDVIRLASNLQYLGNGFFRTFNPTIAATARTQFASGFNYDENPFEGKEQVPVKVSDFFAPATLTESIGLTYDPREWFTQRVGLASKQTLVELERLRPLYGLARDRYGRVELGLESRTEVDRELFENVRLQSALGLFAAFNKADRPDLLWENVLLMKMNPWLGVNLEFVTLYDRDITRDVQIKEVLSVGVTYAIL